MRDYVAEYCDGLDACMFSGDQFLEQEAVDKMECYLKRWESKLTEWKEVIKEVQEEENANGAV